MEERRRHQRTRSLKGASIAFNNQSSAIDCVVKNLSGDGACLEVETSVGVPETFDLVFNQEHVQKPSRVIWRMMRRVGVVFDIARSRLASKV
jgi:hypothetical protein